MSRSFRYFALLASLAPLPRALRAQAAQPATPPAAPAPASRGTDVYVADLRRRDGDPSIGRLRRVTNADGYHNQPAFTPDGRAVLFSAAPGGGPGAPPDIYRYDVREKRVRRLTSTPESEYSPAPLPGGLHFTVLRVERDSAQRLWRLNDEGLVVTPVLPRERRVAYYVWSDSARMVLALLDSGGLSLHVADAGTGALARVAHPVGRSIQRIPGRAAVSFVQRDSAGTSWLMELDPATRRTRRLLPLPAGAEHHAWLPDGTLIAGTPQGLLFTRPTVAGDAWHHVRGQPNGPPLAVSRVAVSPKGDRIAFVAERR
ncbi:MAG TPA: hypothetical protein VF771_20790 [Longimicrobiaceae bacterium]